jgi:hypothetical protein
VLKVWNYALELICRNLKIPAVVLHHMSKAQRGQPPTPRGSSAIMGMADATWLTFGDDISDMGLFPDKTRRGSGLKSLGFGVLDDNSGERKQTMLVPHPRSAQKATENKAGW